MQDFHYRIKEVLNDFRAIGIVEEKLFALSFAPFHKL